MRKVKKMMKKMRRRTMRIEEEEDHKHITNAEYKGKLRPPPVPIAVVKVVPPPTKMKQTARMSTGGKILRHNLASKNPVSNLSRREYMKVPTKDLPGEWDHHLPKGKEKASTPEWKPSKAKIEEKLWGDFARSTEQFQQAYNLMMSVVKDLQDHHNPQEQEKNKKE